MLRTPAPQPLLHVLIHVVTDVYWEEHQITSIDDALGFVVHFQCGTQMCIYLGF